MSAPGSGRAANPVSWSRRAVAEALGTGLLLLAVIGSGIAATRLTDDVAVQLLANAAATAGALAGIIVMVGPVSGAHLNPVVTLAERATGTIDNVDVVVYLVAQTVGAAAGVLLANVLYDLPVVELSSTTRSDPSLWASEVVATVALLLLIAGCVRGGRTNVLPFAVGAWIGGAYWFTSSTSFANPAVTVARTLTDTFAGIEPASAPMFVLAQLVGCAVAVGLIHYLHGEPDGA